MSLKDGSMMTTAASNREVRRKYEELERGEIGAGELEAVFTTEYNKEVGPVLIVMGWNRYV